ncbi:MAG: phage holin family protein [Chloroflexi bacterium]|nr:phage holin family protein [Chloroflexota bacterium]
MKFILRIAVNAVALYAAVAIVPGISPQNPDPVSYIWLALIFGLVNALVKPLVNILACGVILLSLGLATLFINTGLFYLASWIGAQFGFGLNIEGFWAAFLGALVVSVISFVLNIFLPDERGRRRKKDD